MSQGFSFSTVGSNTLRSQYSKAVAPAPALLISSYLQRMLEGFTIQQKHRHEVYNLTSYNLCFNATVNFRGSLGFGQTSLHTLPGNIGTQDVQDVMVSWDILPMISIIIVRTLSLLSNNNILFVFLFSARGY